jgi:uncharacterized membrane protein YbjE (DUF340 family)
MKNSVWIAAFFVLGLGFGLSSSQTYTSLSSLSSLTLYALIFLVGFLVSSDSQSWHHLKHSKARILIIPVLTIFGSLGASVFISFFIKDLSVKESLAVGAGFGYYSVSSLIITELAGKTLGVLALLTNLMREIITLLFAPVLRKFFGRLSPVVAGGATSMDTTLPVIVRYSGKDMAIIAIIHGTILTILVPIAVTFILSIK